MCAKFIGIGHLILKLWSKNQFQMKNFGFRSDMSERNPNFVIWNWFFDHNFEIKCPISIKFRTHNHENTNNVSSNQHK